LSNITTIEPRYYILVGDTNSWQVGFENNQWGFSDKNIGYWNTTNEGDLVAFYVTKPVKSIVGFGKIIKKFISTDILWPDEKLFKKVIWKNRIQFKIIHKVNNWEDGIEVPPTIMLNIGRKVIQKSIFNSLVKSAESKWNKKFSKIITN